MSSLVKLSGKSRQDLGSAACRKLRAAGAVPANVYGHKQDPAPILLEEDAISAVVRSGARIVELDVSGKVETALVKDVQWDTFSSHVMHVDLLRVDSDERVRIDIPIQIRGTAPGVVAGGVMELPHHMVHIECLAVDIPDGIQVRVGSLEIGGVIHVSDLTDVPAGVTVLSAPETVLVHVALPKVEAELEAPAGAGDAAAAPAAAAGKS